MLKLQQMLVGKNQCMCGHLYCSHKCLQYCLSMNRALKRYYWSGVEMIRPLGSATVWLFVPVGQYCCIQVLLVALPSNCRGGPQYQFSDSGVGLERDEAFSHKSADGV